MITLKAKRLKPHARLPEYAHPGDLGCDLFSAVEVTIPHGAQATVATGVAVEFPEGWGGIIKDRSSMASKRVYTSGGVIDHGYRGEIIVLLRNESGKDYPIKRGDKIAQMVAAQAPAWRIVEAVELNNTAREDNGFGSTGT